LGGNPLSPIGPHIDLKVPVLVAEEIVLREVAVCFPSPVVKTGFFGAVDVPVIDDKDRGMMPIDIGQ
jgi:hypothetical protein